MVEEVSVWFLQGLHQVEEHFSQALLEELLRGSAIVYDSEDINGCRLESTWVEVVGKILIGIEVSMLEEEEAVDGEVDDLFQGLTASLEWAEELQKEGHFFPREIDPEVEEEADKWSQMHDIEVVFDILLSVIA